MTNAMEQVETFLKSLGLREYVPAFELNGYDHLVCILTHDDDELDILVSHVGMMFGHLFVRAKQRAIQMCQV